MAAFVGLAIVLVTLFFLEATRAAPPVMGMRSGDDDKSPLSPEAFAAATGLAHAEVGPSGGQLFEGDVEGARVSVLVERFDGDTGRRFYHFRVAPLTSEARGTRQGAEAVGPASPEAIGPASPGIPKHLVVSSASQVSRPSAAKEPFGDQARRALVEDEGWLFTSDHGFDEEVHVKGDEVETIALLDEATRRSLEIAGALGACLFQGAFSCTLRTRFGDAQLVKNVRFAIGVLTQAAKRLVLDESQRPIAARLRHNAIFDSYSDVRWRNLALLVDHFAGTPEAEEAIASALHDSDPPVRLLAAQHAGERGVEILRTIAMAEEIEGWVRAEAIGHVAKTGRAAALELFERVARSPETLAQLAALEGLGNLSPDELPIELLIAIATDAQTRVLSVAARLLARTDDARIEPILIDALHRSADLELCLGALSALGRIGGATTAERLAPCATGFFVPAAIKEAARRAIAEIRARVALEGRGDLSLVEAEARTGALSLERAAGALSVRDEEAS